MGFVGSGVRGNHSAARQQRVEGECRARVQGGWRFWDGNRSWGAVVKVAGWGAISPVQAPCAWPRPSRRPYYPRSRCLTSVHYCHRMASPHTFLLLSFHAPLP